MGGQWANAKIDKETLALFKQIVHIPRKIWNITVWQCLHMPWISSKNY